MTLLEDVVQLKQVNRSENLPDGWAWTKLQNICQVLDNRRVPVNSTEREGRINGKPESELFPYYGATGQVGWIDKYIFDEELVLLGEDGAPFLEKYKNKAYKAKGRYWVNNHAHVLKGLEGILSNSYLHHYLNTFDYYGYVTGTTRLKLNQAEMLKIPVPLPPPTEQERIVAEIEKQFTRLDAAISSLKGTQAKLNRYKASVLKAACEGRLVPQDPNDEPASILLERILKERRDKWEADLRAKGKDPTKVKYEEPARPNPNEANHQPKGWVWVTVEQIGDVQLGRQRSPQNVSKNYPTKYIRAANITEKGLSLSNILEMEFRPEEKKVYRLCEGDILLSEASGSPDQVGKPALWNNEIEDCCFQNTVIRLRPVQINSNYLLVVFKHFYVNGVFARTATGVGINHLSANKFSRLVIPIAPIAEQERIVAEVERRLSIVSKFEASVESSLKRAERLRQSVLKKAFSGRLVTQNPNDEPASLLLERIRAERTAQNLASEGRNKTKNIRPARKSSQVKAVKSGIIQQTKTEIEDRQIVGQNRLPGM